MTSNGNMKMAEPNLQIHGRRIDASRQLDKNVSEVICNRPKDWLNCQQSNLSGAPPTFVRLIFSLFVFCPRRRIEGCFLVVLLPKVFCSANSYFYCFKAGVHTPSVRHLFDDSFLPKSCRALVFIKNVLQIVVSGKTVWIVLLWFARCAWFQVTFIFSPCKSDIKYLIYSSDNPYSSTCCCGHVTSLPWKPRKQPYLIQINN